MDPTPTRVQQAMEFLARLAALETDTLQNLRLPDVDQEPYMGYSLSVREGISIAGTGPRRIMEDFLREADREIDKAGLPSSRLTTATKEAVRAVLVWSIHGYTASGRHLYMPFESVIPHTSIGLRD